MTNSQSLDARLLAVRVRTRGSPTTIGVELAGTKSPVSGVANAQSTKFLNWVTLVRSATAPVKIVIMNHGFFANFSHAFSSLDLCRTNTPRNTGSESARVVRKRDAQ